MNNQSKHSMSDGPYGFWTRKPCFGNALRLFGHLAVLLAGFGIMEKKGSFLLVLCLALVAVWLLAWRLEVGALWRSSLVSAILLSAAGIALWQWNGWGLSS